MATDLGAMVLTVIAVVTLWRRFPWMRLPLVLLAVHRMDMQVKGSWTVAALCVLAWELRKAWKAR